MSTGKVALVTGASSGIGAHSARFLAASGYQVIGAARRTSRVESLGGGITAVALDLCADTSITTAADEVLSRHGRVDLLVNCAGFGGFGSIEETPASLARRQLEVNAIGLTQLTRRLLEPMRRAGSGRIINVSSLAGTFSSPLAGWYHASKFALEALSDSLRLEVAPWGVDVVVIQPGPVRTAWHDRALARLDAVSGEGPYAQNAKAVRAFHEAQQRSAVACSPEHVAAVIVRAATLSRPRSRYPVGRGARTARWMGRSLPDRMFDAMVRARFHLGTHCSATKTSGQRQLTDPDT
jgi:short-subunit dehydrogenase